MTVGGNTDTRASEGKWSNSSATLTGTATYTQSADDGTVTTAD